MSQLGTYDEKPFLTSPIYARDYPQPRNLDPDGCAPKPSVVLGALAEARGLDLAATQRPALMGDSPCGFVSDSSYSEHEKSL
jgi:hypothetical protein